MTKRKPTSHDVARLAGVSRTTVSYVLNGRDSGMISDTTRQRVLDAARQLDYRPNAVARSLRQQRTGIVGLVVHEPADRSTTNIFSPMVIRGISSVLSPAHYRLLVEHVEEPQTEVLSDLVREGHVDGVIFNGARSSDQEMLERYAEQLPIVLWGRLSGVDLPHVDVDNVAGARVAVQWLLRLGHRRIACILNAPVGETGEEAADRLAGYRMALESHGVGYDPSLVRSAQFDAPSGFRAMQSLLTLAQRPAAVFAAGDEVALGALDAARAEGVSVPEQLAVVGFDDIPSALLGATPLTTVHVPAREIGSVAASMCIEMIETGNHPASRIIEPRLVVRESCGARLAGAADDEPPAVTPEYSG